MSVRSIRETLQIARDLDPDVREAIRDTPLANCKKELLALVRLSKEDQRTAVHLLLSGAARRVSELTLGRAVSQRERSLPLRDRRRLIELLEEARADMDEFGYQLKPLEEALSIAKGQATSPASSADTAGTKTTQCRLGAPPSDAAGLAGLGEPARELLELLRRSPDPLPWTPSLWPQRSRSAWANVCRRLEARGLIERRAADLGPSRGRGGFLVLTPAGQALFTSANPCSRLRDSGGELE